MTVALAPTDAERLAGFVAAARRLLVVTGAGCSTESGIPDYRDAEGGWKHSPPMPYRDFAGDRAARRRYWARSRRGWARIDGAVPNGAHLALARLEAAGHLHHLVTQNVDGLHRKAGSRRVIDLHGRLDRVECLGCRTGFPRSRFQEELERLNPGPGPSVTRFRPDGDAVVTAEAVAAFRLPVCPRCGGDLKPGVVFFGEPIPRQRTAAALARLAEADAVLVVGSSLMVGSGYRFARAAARRGLPLALLNLGRTRADAEATLKVAARCGETLPAVAELLGA